MTALAFAAATTHGAVRRAAKAAARVLARIRSAFLRFAALIAEARIHKARLEAELYLNCISVTSNVAPGLARSLFLRRRQGARAQALADMLAQLTTALFRETNPAPVKYALSLLGQMSASVRLPLVEPTLDTRREIQAALARVEECSPDYLVADRRLAVVRAAAE